MQVERQHIGVDDPEVVEFAEGLIQHGKQPLIKLDRNHLIRAL